MTQRIAVLLVAIAGIVCLLTSVSEARLQATDTHLGQAAKLNVVRDRGLGSVDMSGRTGNAPVATVNPNAANSRGALVAQTYVDWHATSTYQGMVDINPFTKSSDMAGVHFTYMSRTGGANVNNKSGYSAFDPVTGTFPIPGGKVVVVDGSTTSSEASQYPRLMIDPDGKAIISQNFWADAASTADVAFITSFDVGPMSGQFGDINGGSVMATDTMHRGDLGGTGGPFPTQWPEPAITITGSDTIMYLSAVENNCEAICPSGIKVWRKVGTSAPGPDPTWTLVFADTAWWTNNVICTDPTSTRVALIWTLGPEGDRMGSAQNYDVWYADSPTGLNGTWTKHNVTNYSGPGYRAYMETAALFDSAGKLHIIWTAGYGTTNWGPFQGRFFHWSEYNSSLFSVIYPFEWPIATCYQSTNVMNIARFGIGECSGRLYVVFTSWNDPTFTPLSDDCCASAAAGNAANGEIYMTVSKDIQGKSWDKPRNLSNSYTPNCDTGAAAPSPCAADNYASITRSGIDDAVYYGTEDWTNAFTYDPTGGSYTGSSYIQVFYATDRYPGYANRTGQGPWTLNDLRWIRLACVPPIVAPSLLATPSSIAFPEWAHPGTPKTYWIGLENNGNADATITSVTAVEDSARGVGPHSNWLAYSSAPGMIPEAGRDSLLLTVNAAGVITAGPTVLFGKLQIAYTTPANTLTIPIQFTVADTVVSPVWDTVATNCLSLAVGSDGNTGHNYGDSLGQQVGQVNMDYFGNTNECDTGGNSRGDSRIYLGDGSPVILRKTATTLNGSWSAFSSGAAGTFFATPNGFKPVTGAGYAPHGSFSTASYDGFNSGTFLTVDSLVKVERTWWAPKHADSCNFIIERTRVFPATISAAVTGLQIGEMIDFDVPSDSGNGTSSITASLSANVGGSDATRRLVYQRGFNSADATTDCTDNSRRYAGVALLNWHMKNKACYDSIFGGATVTNREYVYGGLVTDSLTKVMHVSGFSNAATIEDLSSILTFKDGATGYTLPANDTLSIYTALATVRTAASTAAGLDSLKAAVDKAKNFMKKTIGVCNSCCIGKRGNVNGLGITDLSDLSLLVCYLTGGGCTLPCPDAANVNGSGIVDLSDLSSLVSYLTGGGYALPNCP